jgi:CubicO group peptidase (beta-lactamase class C family)
MVRRRRKDASNSNREPTVTTILTTTSVSGFKDEPAGSRSDDARAREIMNEVASRDRIPGMSVAVARPDRLLYAAALGYADLQTRRAATVDDQYPWFSMTKIATATTAMRLHVEGLLDIDRPIGAYLPDYRPHPRWHPTTRQLLSHTAGLGNPLPVRWVRATDQPPDPAFVAQVVAKHGTPRRAAGAQASYSNIGYLLAGEVIASVTGVSVEASVRNRVLDPLDMQQTGYDYHPEAPRAVGYVRAPRATVPLLRAVLPRGIVGAGVDGYTALKPFLVNGAAYGGLVGTAADAVRLAAAHAAQPTDPHVLLSHPHLDAMRTITAAGRRFDHGIGWFRKPADAARTPGFVEHYGTGGGFWNAMRVYPDQRLALVAMTNTTSAWGVDRLFTQLKDLSWT